jgi:hypothetical protein
VEIIPNLWSELANGAMYARANKRAVNGAPDKQLETLNDPQSAHLLPRLGFELRSNLYSGGNAQVRTTWQRDYAWSCFLTQLTEKIGELVTSRGNPDGSVTQTVAAENVVESWWKKRDANFIPSSRLQPTPQDAPIHIAIAIAASPGPAWTVSDDGVAITRLLPAWPLRYAPKGASQPLKLELKNRMLLDCVCWAYLPKESRANPNGEHEVAFLSFVGPQKKLKAGWATLMDNKRELMRLPTPPAHEYDNPKPVLARRCEGKGSYRTFWNDAPLEESGLAHVAIQHASVFDPRTAQPFIHITGADGTPDLMFFMQQMELASTLPLHPSWAEQLWQMGRQEKVIVQLPAHGCCAYWIDAGDEGKWADIAARCGGAKNARIETIGQEQDDTPRVAMLVTEVESA